MEKKLVNARRVVTKPGSSSAMVARIAKGAGRRRGDRLGISDCRRTMRDSDRPEVDARAGADHHRRGDGRTIIAAMAVISLAISGGLLFLAQRDISLGAFPRFALNS